MGATAGDLAPTLEGQCSPPATSLQVLWYYPVLLLSPRSPLLTAPKEPHPRAAGWLRALAQVPWLEDSGFIMGSSP